MNPADLGTIGAGFSHLSRDSQAVFRVALEAWSHPGRLVDVTHPGRVPAPGHAASAVLLLALLDTETRLWLSRSLAGTDTAAWLRFHTGCILVDEPAQAQFAWAAHPDQLPALQSFPQGSDAGPDQSVTCVLDVPALAGEAGVGSSWILRGPGIREQVRLRVEGLPKRFAAQFAAQWAANHEAFPRGVDLFLATPRQIAGLPRTTRIELEA